MEEFSENVSSEARLQAERKKLEFQDKLDDTRKQVSKDNISELELDDLDAELFDVMPPSVKSHVSSFEITRNAPDAKSIFTKNVNLVETGFTPSASQILTYDQMG